MFTAELLLPSGNRIELIGCAPIFPVCETQTCSRSFKCSLVITSLHVGNFKADSFCLCSSRSDANGSPLVRIAPGVQAGELSQWTDDNAV